MTVNRPDRTVIFGEYRPGEVFMQDNKYFLCIEEVETSDYSYFNAINLETGETAYFDEGTLVNLCRVELEVK